MSKTAFEENIESEKHIEEVCELLKQAWLNNPKMTLGKLVGKLSLLSKSVVPYFMSDFKAIETLKQIIEGAIIIPIEQEIISSGPIIIEHDAKPKKEKVEEPKKKRKSKEPKEEITDEDAEAIKKMNKALKKKVKK